MNKQELIEKICSLPSSTKSTIHEEFLVKLTALDGSETSKWNEDKLQERSKESLEAMLQALQIEFKDFGTLNLSGDLHTIKDKIWVHSVSENLKVEIFLLDNQEMIMVVTDDPGTPDQKEYRLEMSLMEFTLLNGLMGIMIDRHNLKGLIAILAQKNIDVQTIY